jgi:serine/threonine protein kinase
VDSRLFLYHLERSGLVSEDQVQNTAKRLDHDDLRQVAVSLVADGILTRFQVRQLLAGNSKGFVLGRYRILDQIGQGGMGIVYKAIHTGMRRLVAIKVLRPTVATDEEWRQHLFQREALAAAQLDHPNIVTLYDADKVGSVYFLAMEYVKGPNFKRLVREKGPLPIWLACEAARQVAEALDHAHVEGFVHRDIKPSNMLLAPTPSQQTSRIKALNTLAAESNIPGYRVKVLDFGLSRLRPSHQYLREEDGTLQALPGVVWGTFDFVSPEQLVDVHAVDIRSDLYSLGCSMYFLLTGQPPYGDGSLAQRLIKRATEDPEPLMKLRPEIPRPVGKIVDCLMERSPANRYQTPHDVAVALSPFCKPESSIENILSAAWETAAEPQHEPLEETAPKRMDNTDAELEVAPVEELPALAFSDLNSSSPIVERPSRGKAKSTSAKGKGLRVWLGLGLGTLALVALLVWLVV